MGLREAMYGGCRRACDVICDVPRRAAEDRVTSTLFSECRQRGHAVGCMMRNPLIVRRCLTTRGIAAATIQRNAGQIVPKVWAVLDRSRMKGRAPQKTTATYAAVKTSQTIARTSDARPGLLKSISDVGFYGFDEHLALCTELLRMIEPYVAAEQGVHEGSQAARKAGVRGAVRTFVRVREEAGT